MMASQQQDATRFVFLILDLVCVDGVAHSLAGYTCTVVSRVSAHGCLNITRDFGPHGRLPGIKIPYVCIEAATVAP